MCWEEGMWMRVGGMRGELSDLCYGLHRTPEYAALFSWHPLETCCPPEVQGKSTEPRPNGVGWKTYPVLKSQSFCTQMTWGKTLYKVVQPVWEMWLVSDPWRGRHLCLPWWLLWKASWLPKRTKTKNCENQFCWTGKSLSMTDKAG